MVADEFNSTVNIQCFPAVTLYLDREQYGGLTFGFSRLLSRVELSTDIHQPSLQLHLFLQSELFPGLASTVLTCCMQTDKHQ